MTKLYLDYAIFDSSTAKSTGGVTGSKQVKTRDGTVYQRKPSILDAGLTRRMKVASADIENFGEVIAAAVSRAIIVRDAEVELVPEVSVVYKKKRGRVLVASRYLQNVEGTLDEYAEKQGVHFQGKHTTISTRQKNQGTLNIGGDENRLMRQDLARAIAISALSGDHDVNPGNMMVVKDKDGNNRVGRIDFGHAFNDLINAPQMIGGALRNKDNQILDFFNREQVAYIIDGERRESKLWRSYQEIVPSLELAEALREIADSNGLQVGLGNAKAAFMELIQDLNQDPQNNKKTLDHVKYSLAQISNNVSPNKIDHAKLGAEEVAEQVFQNLEKFYRQNQQQIGDVAKLMEMQVKIDQLIMDKKNGKPVNQELLAEVKKNYEELKEAKGIGIEGKGIQWVKTTKEIPAFKGTLDEFIQVRSRGMGVKAKGIDDLAPQAQIEVKNNLTAIAKFIDDSLQVYINEPQPINQARLCRKFDLLADRMEADLKQANMDSPELISIVRKEIKNYAKAMDEQLSGASNDILAAHKIKKSPITFAKAVNAAALESNFAKAKEILAHDPLSPAKEALPENLWKKAAKAFEALGMNEASEWCNNQSNLARAKHLVQDLGLNKDIAKHLSSDIGNIQRNHPSITTQDKSQLRR